MTSILTISTSIRFNSEFNTLLGLTNKEYSEESHKSVKPVLITTTGKVHLECKFVDDSIVNGIREQMLSSFNSSAPPGNKNIKEPRIILFKKKKKTSLDSIQVFLEVNN